MLSADYRRRWVSPRAAWSYVTRRSQAQTSHPICRSAQRWSAPCLQIPLKLTCRFNTCRTSRGTFQAGWILCSTCREISCFLVEGGLLSPILTSGDVELLFHHLPLFRLVPPMHGDRRGASRVALPAPLIDTGSRKDSRSQKGCLQDCSTLR